jgi:hypothetical protein
MIELYVKIINYNMSLIFILIPAIQVKFMPKQIFLKILQNYLVKKRPIRCVKKFLKVLLTVIIFLNGIERMLTQEPLQGVFKSFLV